jgi:hypothetical protein
MMARTQVHQTLFKKSSKRRWLPMMFTALYAVVAASHLASHSVLSDELTWKSRRKVVQGDTGQRARRFGLVAVQLDVDTG